MITALFWKMKLKIMTSFLSNAIEFVTEIIY